MKNIEAKMAVLSKTQFANGRHQVNLVCINAEGAANSDGEARIVIDNIEALNEFVYGTAYRVVFVPVVAAPEPKKPTSRKPAKKKPTTRKKSRR